jgi:sulfate adenylyltransferase subunit 1
MEQEELKFVIVGHVDHGKSTLIGRLLFDTGSLPEGKIEEIRQICESLGKDFEFGYVTDSFEEERDRGITIDTAQISFRTELRDYVIIDAPGHVEFLKNMITGASQADAAVLIVDTVEGVMEQTKRHAYILHLLGIHHVLVVINKMDLAGFSQTEFQKISGDIAAFLDTLSIRPAQFIPISGRHGDNVCRASPRMQWYEGPTLIEALDGILLKKDSKDGPLRFTVQDVYSFEKRIYVGRVESGTLHAGETVTVLPLLEATKVQSIEEYQKDLQEAVTGKAVGLTIGNNLPVDRGHVLARDTDLPVVTDRIKASLFWMDTSAGRKEESFIFRCATQEVPCKLTSIEQTMNTSTLEVTGRDLMEVKNREVAEVTIKTLHPVVIDSFSKVRELGRFVLSRRNIVAGGIIRETGL